MAENKKSSISKRSSIYLLNVKQPDDTVRKIKLSFQRTRASINILKTETTVDASMGLVDLTEQGSAFFTTELLPKGAIVHVGITEPRILNMKGVVAWSVPVTSGVLGSRFPFRTGVQFIFENETQRTALTEFIQRVNTDPLANLKMSMAPMPGLNTDVPASAPATGLAEAPTDATAPIADAGPSGEAPVATETTPDSSAEPTAATAPVPSATGEGEGGNESGGGESQAA